MSTRGMVGIVINGEEKFWYNHYDSYPGGLGSDVLAEVKREMENSALFRVRAEQVHVYNEVGEIPDDLADQLSEARGSVTQVLDLKAILDSSEFAKDSLFCEWGYIIDFDFGNFEVYKGFQTEPVTAGRWLNDPHVHVSGSGSTYYPINKIAVWPLDSLPTDLEFAQYPWHEDDEDEDE